MPKRPPTSGYARLTQTEEDEQELIDDEERDDALRGLPSSSAANPNDRTFAPVQPARRTTRMQAASKAESPHHRRHRSNSGVDLKSLNQRLERWAEEIATKLKLKKGSGKNVDTDQLEIQHSVFQAPDGIRPATAESLHTQYAEPAGTRLTPEEFDAIIESVRIAIENDVHPTLIAQGSSGSYFARNSAGVVVGVFKPKDEEPYASRNPKWTKWIHRNLFPFFFGRACLIPNLSYISEAAAYVLDTQLRCNLVPYTDVVSFSSKSFFYDFWDRRAFYRKKKALPEKPGSFQVFLKGYKDATRFFKEHPWPDQAGNSLEEAPSRKRKRRGWTDDCSRTNYSDDEHESEPLTSEESSRRKVFWTEGLQNKFRQQLEKLVILDYIMRNTDRGSDNWMIRVDEDTEEAEIIIEPPAQANGQARPAREAYNRPLESMIAQSRSGTPSTNEEEKASIHIGAIDNSLSWPWKHPDAWRSYPFGWLFLPVSLIGQPFTEETRQHFLPLLTSKAWWTETQLALRKCFQRDADFQERMFAKQMAVMKGQAWNVVETLKSSDHGPLELTRRARVHVWDDLVEVPVAVPMRTQSSELRRALAAESQEAEEMDLSVASLPAPRPRRHDIPILSPDVEVDNPFNMSRQASQQDIAEAPATKNGTLSPPNVRFLSASDHKIRNSSSSRPNNKSRMSLDERRWQRESPSRRHQRRLSHSLGYHGEWTDEDEGDLGYAATADRESNRKMVIVERLETVKGNNPVFTWC